MKSFQIPLLLAGLAVLSLQGCGPKEVIRDESKGNGFVRFVNVTGEPFMTSDGRADPKPELSDGQVSPRRRSPVGPRPLKATRDGKVLAEEDVQVALDETHTMYVFLSNGATKHKVFIGDPQSDKTGNVAIRLVNLIEGEKASASTDDPSATTIGKDVPGLEASAVVQLTPATGGYVVKVGKEAAKIPAFPRSAREGYSIAAYRDKDGKLKAAILRHSASQMVGGGGRMQ